MKTRTLIAIPRIITVAGTLSLTVLFGCGDPSGVEDDFFVSNVTGLVLEYTDDTRTTTAPVVDAMLELILPDGQTREFCIGLNPSCIDLQWVAQAWTNMEFPGRYLFRIGDPAHCSLRVRAYGEPIKTGKTATAPRLAEVCENGGTQEGPTLIVE